jgi:putative PIN family toxin of toxin-antitoxin system
MLNPAAACATPEPVPAQSSANKVAAPLVVLDSNVWLDILLFDDPVSRPIRAALENGALDAVTESRCVAELMRVLDYARFGNMPAQRASAPAQFARLARLISPDSPAGPPLPACRDRDDQKFLELAYTSGATWLVTKDRDLLRMGRRMARYYGFSVLTPADFVVAGNAATGRGA